MIQNGTFKNIDSFGVLSMTQKNKYHLQDIPYYKT